MGAKFLTAPLVRSIRRGPGAAILWDTCVLLTPPTRATSGVYRGHDTGPYTDGASVDCKISIRGQDEGMNISQIPEADGMALFSIDLEQALTARHRIRWTKEKGRTMTTPQTFAFIGHPKPVVLGLAVPIKLLPGGLE